MYISIGLFLGYLSFIALLYDLCAFSNGTYWLTECPQGPKCENNGPTNDSDNEGQVGPTTVQTSCPECETSSIWYILIGVFAGTTLIFVILTIVTYCLLRRAKTPNAYAKPDTRQQRSAAVDYQNDAYDTVGDK